MNYILTEEELSILELVPEHEVETVEKSLERSFNHMIDLEVHDDLVQAQLL